MGTPRETSWWWPAQPPPPPPQLSRRMVRDPRVAAKKEADVWSIGKMLGALLECRARPALRMHQQT